MTEEFDNWIKVQQEQKCLLCDKTKEFYSSPYCVSCIHIIYGVKGNNMVDNFVGYICYKLGIGITPMACIITGELTLSHIMHHAVILPTPVGYEMFEMTMKMVYVVKGYKEKIEQSRLAKIAGKISNFLLDGVLTWRTYAEEARERRG